MQNKSQEMGPVALKNVGKFLKCLVELSTINQFVMISS